MSYPSERVGTAYQSYHANVEVEKKAGETANKNAQDKINQIFQQEQQKIAEEAAHFDEEQRKERAFFEKQRAAQQHSSQSQSREFSANMHAHQSHQQKEEEAFQEALAQRKAQFQEQMRQRQADFEKKVQDYQAAQQSNFALLKPAPINPPSSQASFQIPTFSQFEPPSAAQTSFYSSSPYVSQYGQSSSKNEGLPPLPNLGSPQLPPSSNRTTESTSYGRSTNSQMPAGGGGGLTPLPSLAPLPPLGTPQPGNPPSGDSSTHANEGDQNENCVSM